MTSRLKLLNLLATPRFVFTFDCVRVKIHITIKATQLINVNFYFRFSKQNILTIIPRYSSIIYGLCTTGTRMPYTHTRGKIITQQNVRLDGTELKK